jgi:hypothetical protein
MGDQMVKVIVGGGKPRKIPFGPVYFTRDYVKRGFFKDKTYPQGRRGVVLEEHTLLGKVTHVDLRLPDGEYLLEVPIDYVSLPPAATGRRNCRRRCGGGGRRLLGHRRRGEFNGRAVNCHADHLKRHVSAEPHTAEVD